MKAIETLKSANRKTRIIIGVAVIVIVAVFLVISREAEERFEETVGEMKKCACCYMFPK